MVYDKPHAPQEIIDLQRWCNNKMIFKSEKDFLKYSTKIRGKKSAAEGAATPTTADEQISLWSLYQKGK